jgi:hypothetical protein
MSTTVMYVDTQLEALTVRRRTVDPVLISVLFVTRP